MTLAASLVKGSRIVLIPMEYESPVRETLAWLTDIIEAIDGREQRLAIRKQPKQIFRVTYQLDGNDRQRMQALMLDWMDNNFGFPLWHERLFLTGAVSSSATQYPVSGADDVDLRVGGLAVVLSDNETFDVINISALTDTLITASDPSVNAYAAGTPVMPLRIAFLRGAVQGSRFHVELESFTLTFEVVDNDTGAVAGSTTPGFWSLYNSRVLFDDCNVMGAKLATNLNRKVTRIDNETGLVSNVSSWDRGKRSHNKGFKLRSRADIMLFRKLMTSLRGRQKAVYIPTFIEDLTVVDDLTFTASTMDIQAIEYVRFAQSRLPMSLIKLTFTDDTTLTREVLSAATISPTIERLTVDIAWPSPTKTAAEVRRVEFFELVRFDTDNINITYPRIGLADCEVPMVRVFDDNA